MPRARFSTGWGIRRDRKAQRGTGAGGGGGGGGVIGPGGVPLPASAVEYWHSELGLTLIGGTAVDRWQGQILGHTVIAPSAGQRPVYGVDAGGPFNDRPVVQCSVTSGRCLNSTTDTTMLALGARPYVCAVMRARAYPATLLGVYHFTDFPISSSAMFCALNTGTSIESQVSGALTAAGSPAAATDALFLETFLNASGSNTIAINGVQLASVDTGKSTTKAITRVAVGVNGAGALRSDTTFALLLLCGSVPSAAERAALRAYAQTTWGTP